MVRHAQTLYNPVMPNIKNKLHNAFLGNKLLKCSNKHLSLKTNVWQSLGFTGLNRQIWHMLVNANIYSATQRIYA